MRILVEIAYQGNQFGFQIQQQGEQYNNNLKRFFVCTSVMYEYIPQVVRTEAHAYQQFFHFDTELNIDNQQWQYAMNRFLPNDIYVKSVQTVDENFHCERYDCVEKISL